MSSVLDQAVAALSTLGHSLTEALEVVPATPGLYAFHGAPHVWVTLGLGQASDGRPLYVGKAERSLHSRDVLTHFATGKTGSSTVRRSLAALLQEHLNLVAIPRGKSRSDRSANYALEEPDDERLSSWMAENLRLATWSSEPGGVVLDELETAVLRELGPPLNLVKVRTQWRAQVRSARRRLAAQARAELASE